MEKTSIPGVYKDGEGVLINKDAEGLKAYRLRKQKNKQIDKLQSDVDEIKKMLTILLGRTN